MTEPARDIAEERLLAVSGELAEERAAWLARQPRPTVADEVAAIRREVARRRRPAWRRPAAAGLAAAVVVAAAVLLVIVRGPEPLTASVAGGPVHPGDRLVARAEGVALSFDDGSRIALDAGSTARMTALDAHEVRVDVERGSIDVDVVHAEGRTWWIGVGDSSIEVVGTTFRVSVDPAGDAAGVTLTEGAVRVVGPCADPREVHRAPAKFRVGCGPAPNPSSPGAAPSTSATAAPAASSAAPAPAAPPPWRAARSRGDFRAAFELAATEGLDAVVATADAAELLDLALGARLAGSPEAGRLYQGIRDRFAGSDAAAGAAFHLGRAAFDRGAWAEADRWFAVYLAERPGGPLAAEALGRSIECAENLGATDQARAHAVRYLERFPDGPQATRARRLIEGSPVDASPSGGERGTSPPP